MGHESLIQRRPSLSHPGWLKYFFSDIQSITLNYHTPSHIRPDIRLGNYWQKFILNNEDISKFQSPLPQRWAKNLEIWDLICSFSFAKNRWIMPAMCRRQTVKSKKNIADSDHWSVISSALHSFLQQLFSKSTIVWAPCWPTTRYVFLNTKKYTNMQIFNMWKSLLTIVGPPACWPPTRSFQVDKLITCWLAGRNNRQ